MIVSFFLLHGRTIFVPSYIGLDKGGYPVNIFLISA